MRITAYHASRHLPVLKPSSSRRTWMDQTRERWAYRCLPLTIANVYGWELLSSCSFEVLWNGGDGRDALTIVRLGGEGELPMSHFGYGVLTFETGYLFETEYPQSLYVSGPVNSRKDGIVPLTGIVETSWLPFPFTMNWGFTRSGVPIRFEEGEPFCQFFPVQLDTVEKAEPELREFTEGDALGKQFAHWFASRRDHNKEQQSGEEQPKDLRWQKFYHRGEYSDGKPAAAVHRTKLDVRPFAVPTVPVARTTHPDSEPTLSEQEAGE